MICPHNPTLPRAVFPILADGTFILWFLPLGFYFIILSWPESSFGFSVRYYRQTQKNQPSISHSSYAFQRVSCCSLNLPTSSHSSLSLYYFFPMDIPQVRHEWHTLLPSSLWSNVIFSNEASYSFSINNCNSQHSVNPVTLLWFFSITHHVLTCHIIHLCVITIFVIFHNENVSPIKAKTWFVSLTGIPQVSKTLAELLSIPHFIC